MAKQLFANNATSMLSGILTQGGNVLVCSNGEGNRFPSPAADEYFLLTIYTKDAYANEQKVEVVKVTSRAGDTLMIERDVELLTGQSGGYAYNGNTEQVYLELRWTAAGAGNVLQASDNLASLENAATARTNLGLGNVNNTADVNKPISTATQAALNGKADTAHTHAGYVVTSDPRLSDFRPASDVSAWAKAATKPSYTKTEVGLGNVDNTSDANKPVSTATQTALNAKQDTLVSGTNIKTINNQSILGAGNIEIQGGVGVALSGDLNIYVTQSKTYTITNYNVFSSYIVQVSAGSVSLSGDQISFTAPATAQTVTLTVTMDSAATQFSLVVQAAGVTTPTNSSPSNGATDQNGMVTLTSSAFAWYALSDTHLNSDWQLATDAGFTSIVQSTSTDATNKTSWAVSGLSTSQTYYWRVRHRGTNNGVSSWSTGTSFATKASYAYVNTPTVTTPTNGQTEIPEQPTLQSSAFATTGSADTHASSQWQIRLAGGTWAAPLHDSGASTTNKTSYTVPAGVLVAGQTQYVMRVRHTGTSLGASEWSSDIAFTTKQQFAQIIGIVCTATGGGAGTWQRIDENFNAITTTAATFNNHPTYAGVVAQTIDGQAMMKVPKYYLKTGTVPSGTYAGKRYWMVSDQPVSGFSVHPAFMNAGAQIDQFWVGKYQGTTDGTKLGSVAGNTPLVSIDFPTMQTRANNRNTGGVTGFGLWNIYQLSAIQTLALIEIGGSDSQTLVGQGNVSGSAALAVDNATVAQASWRGIVGLWGNVWQMVDGLQTDASSKYMIWDKNGNKTYKTTSLTAPGSNYPVTMATASGTDYDLATVFAAETTNATAGNGTYGDYFYQNPSCVAYHGGHWGHGAPAGLFYLYVTNAASASSASVGGRLAKV